MIIGSNAIKYHFPDFPREPKDIDYIEEEYNLFEDIYNPKNLKIERLKNPVLISHYKKEFVPYYCDINELYTLKISHTIGWKLENNSWDKHVYDIQFLKKKGAKLDRDLFNRLYEYWGTIHGRNKRSDLEMSAEDFFTNKVDSPHEHDYIHTLLNPFPTFRKILKDEVEVCEEKIKALTFEEKCDLIREEVMVMASERYKGMDFRHRYNRMLKKFIISHAPIEVGIFALENYPLLERPLFNFMERINSKLKEQGLQTLN